MNIGTAMPRPGTGSAIQWPEPRHAHRGAEFPGLCLLLTRNCKRALKIGFRFPCIRLSLLLCDSAGYTLEFRLIPAFPHSFRF